jgi:hypothetical protein
MVSTPNENLLDLKESSDLKVPKGFRPDSDLVDLTGDLFGVPYTLES